MRTPQRRAKAQRTPRRVPAAKRLPQIRLPRPHLLASTALTACFALALGQALAQPAPNARPEGGNVVAGQASIARQPNNTVVTQSSQRTAIEWRSFDIGRDQTVTFQQPAPSAIALNRVTSANPTEIAGRIQANGQVVVVNGAGIMVHQGAVVEAQSFIATTADTTNAAFMAGGRLTFDRPGQPGARVVNQGEITVREAGLAALVAPGVANSGRVRARLGTVVLAGAETHTIDLHGDGLVTFDVTGQVRTAPLGPDGRPVQALVTNTGTIIAEGGNVLITARAVDGLVQDLVTVGGTVRADSVGDRTGTIQVTGVGGGIRVHGTVAADGVRAGERGGTVVVNGPGEVTLGSTARVTTSGP
ncbi:two-partner secretion domain-containing protein, partial [Falsiroseomonas oryziterrae]|uniref:two-partner secretion domain-containing protein n=1 Tax=Falsiroseomonas oryziterrae TaxID=2911368 RepID=UPI001F28380E